MRSSDHNAVVECTADQWEQKAGQRNALACRFSVNGKLVIEVGVYLNRSCLSTSPWFDISKPVGEIVKPRGENQNYEASCSKKVGHSQRDVRMYVDHAAAKLSAHLQ